MNRSSAALVAALLALTGCPGSEEEDPPPPPQPPPVVVETFQAASTLIGQADWDDAALGACTASSITDPTGPVAWDGTSLLVPDSWSGRLLAFTPVPPAESDPATAPAASFVIGEPDLTTCNDASSTLVIPQAPFVAGSALVVADSGLNQVLVWNATPGSWNTAPDRVFGDGFSECTATGLMDPRSAVIAGSRLIVADTLNSRVLIYDLDDPSMPVAVLGQVLAAGADPFTNCAPNDPGTGPQADPTASTLKYPTGVWTDGTRLFVADTENNRVLIWNAVPTVSGAAADVVVGQSDFGSTQSTPDATHMDGPSSVTSDGEQLFVADTWNHRVLVYGTIPTSNGAAATKVLGQGDFTHSAPNDDDQDWNVTTDPAPTARTLSFPNGVAVVDGLLAVTDWGNRRVVVYRPPAN